MKKKRTSREKIWCSNCGKKIKNRYLGLCPECGESLCPECVGIIVENTNEDLDDIVVGFEIPKFH